MCLGHMPFPAAGAGCDRDRRVLLRAVALRWCLVVVVKLAKNLTKRETNEIGFVFPVCEGWQPAREIEWGMIEVLEL